MGKKKSAEFIFEKTKIEQTEMLGDFTSLKPILQLNEKKNYEHIPSHVGDVISIQNEFQNDNEKKIETLQLQPSQEKISKNIIGEKSKEEIDIKKISKMGQSIKFDSKGYEDRKQKKIENLEITWKEWIQIHMYNKNLPKNLRQKLKIRKVSQEKFEEQLDLIRVLKKLQEIDTLKYLVLNEQQRALFEMLSKPLLYFEEKEIDSSPTSKYMKMFSSTKSKERKKSNIEREKDFEKV